MSFEERKKSDSSISFVFVCSVFSSSRLSQSRRKKWFSGLAWLWFFSSIFLVKPLESARARRVFFVMQHFGVLPPTACRPAKPNCIRGSRLIADVKCKSGFRAVMLSLRLPRKVQLGQEKPSRTGFALGSAPIIFQMLIPPDETHQLTWNEAKRRNKKLIIRQSVARRRELHRNRGSSDKLRFQCLIYIRKPVSIELTTWKLLGLSTKLSSSAFFPLRVSLFLILASRLW